MKIISTLNNATGAPAFVSPNASDNVQEVSLQSSVKVANAGQVAITDRPRLLERRQTRFNRRVAH
ncbi:MAG: hypothetical protein AAFR51_14740 [Pseudomonadota bacterium]